MTPSREAIAAAVWAIGREMMRQYEHNTKWDAAKDVVEDFDADAVAKTALAAAYARDFPQPSKSDEELWRDILEKDDRTSPSEYPDMALITADEFKGAISLTRRNIARQYGACLSCLEGLPYPMGCTDCLGTGYDGGAPQGFVSEIAHEAIRAEATLAERERCAKVADMWGAYEIAAAIRKGK